jgi:hypothetical protein
MNRRRDMRCQTRQLTRQLTRRLIWPLISLCLTPVLLHGAPPVLEETVPDTLRRILPVPQHALGADSVPLASVSLLHNRATASRNSGRDSGSDGSRLWRPALVASAGLAVTGAVVAYWSNRQAGEAYDRYLHSAGAARQQDSLDRAERYDRLAGASFLVMEAGIVLTARFVFF